MRLGKITLMATAVGAALAIAGCGEPDAATANTLVGNLEGDAALVASAQTISDAIGVKVSTVFCPSASVALAYIPTILPFSTPASVCVCASSI